MAIVLGSIQQGDQAMCVQCSEVPGGMVDSIGVVIHFNYSPEAFAHQFQVDKKQILAQMERMAIACAASLLEARPEMLGVVMWIDFLVFIAFLEAKPQKHEVKGILQKFLPY